MSLHKLTRATLHVFDEGSGPPLLLVHGFPLDHTMWAHTPPLLCNKFRVIAPDLRGFGRSPWPNDELPQNRDDIANNRVKFTIADFADDLAELLSSLNISEPITLCGLSMGGYIAFQFWKRHREKMSRLILCDTRAQVDSEQAAAARFMTAEKVLTEGPAFLIDAMIPKLYCSASIENKIAAVEESKQTILRTDPRAIAAASVAMAHREDFTKQLSSITIPTLLICGEHDSISPVTEMSEMAKDIPHSSFVKIANAGHMTPTEQPTAFAKAILNWASSPK
jgi:pimeloyl-ACP methyl ester carboxylesterase